MTEQAILALDRAGADVIELGVPYSVGTSACPGCAVHLEVPSDFLSLKVLIAYCHRHRMMWRSHLTYTVTSQDPLADGPTIQAAGTRALAAGCTLDKVCSLKSGSRSTGKRMQCHSSVHAAEEGVVYAITSGGLTLPQRLACR